MTSNSISTSFQFVITINPDGDSTDSHATHHLYAIYAMGADRKLLEAAYQTHVVYQRPAFESPEAIDDGNWKDHLADERWDHSFRR